MAALSRAALAAPPFIDSSSATAAAPRARLSIPRCLKSAIRSRRTAEFPRRCCRLAAVQRPSPTTPTASSTTPTPHPLDAEASELRHALSNRGATGTTDPLLLDRARELALSLAAARRGGGGGGGGVGGEAAAFLDALGGAVARMLEQQKSASSSSSSSSSISSLEATARLAKAYAQAGHRTLATSELARAAVRQACRSLVATFPPSSSPSSATPPPPPPPPVPVFAAAASIARSVSCLGINPGARLMEALSSSAVAFAGGGGRRRGTVSSGGVSGPSATTDGDSSSSGGGSFGGTGGEATNEPRLPSRLPASAVVDWLCAAASARHALPRGVAALAATARFNPIQAAAAAAALASLGCGCCSGNSGRSDGDSPPPPSFPTLVSTLRSRVAGSPRGGVPPRAAVAASWALASWGQLDAASAAALAEHAEAGVVAAGASSSSGSEASASDSASTPSSSPSPSANNLSLLGEEDLVSLWGALRAAGWRRAAGGTGSGAEAVAAPPASARATRAASAARAAAVAAAAELNARGPPREISKLSERLLMLPRCGVRARVLAPSADDCLLWRVEARKKRAHGGGSGDDGENAHAAAAAAVAVVALSPPDNASSNCPVVALGLASVELNAASRSRPREGRGEKEEEEEEEEDEAGGDDGGGAVCFRGLLFPGAGDDEQEALAAAVEEALGIAAGGA